MNEKNIGIDILKILMSFQVVMCHFWNGQITNSLLIIPSLLRSAAVPIFMIIAFWLTGKKITQGYDYLKARIRRLWEPLFAWTFIIYIIYRLEELLFGMEFLKWQDILWQLLTGHSNNINPAMWFQVNLIWITIVFGLIYIKLGQKKGTICILILAIIALVAQYLGINSIMFGRLEFELKYPLGRLVEMIPYATIGCLISHYDIFHQISIKRKNNIVFIALCICIYWGSKYIFSPKGFGYQGIGLISLSVLVVYVFYLIGNYINIKYIHIAIKYLKRYTMGVYCSHLLVGHYITIIWENLNFERGTIKSCLIIYIFSNIISFLISLIPIKKASVIVQ